MNDCNLRHLLNDFFLVKDEISRWYFVDIFLFKEHSYLFSNLSSSELHKATWIAHIEKYFFFFVLEGFHYIEILIF